MAAIRGLPFERARAATRVSIVHFAETVNRRALFYGCAAMAAAGLAASAWPLVDQMNPDARALAADEVIDVHLDGLRLARFLRVQWRNWPILVAYRSADVLAAMQDPAHVRRLRDPDSKSRQQPTYAQKWHRSIDPAYAVLVGVCTRCACVPHYVSDDASAPDLVGSYLCPCCASHYDPAGRASTGVTQYNLPVPPYDIVDHAIIRIGRNLDASFSMGSIERI
jgi:ubiquinol-cytochrome c reductase iron-sulfur subunit